MIKKIFVITLVICIGISNLLASFSAPQNSASWGTLDLSQFENINWDEVKLGNPQTGKMWMGYNINDLAKAKTILEYPVDTKIDEMDFVFLGNYDQGNSNQKSLIRWVILEKQDDRALLLSQDLLDISDINSEWSLNENDKYNPYVRLQQVKSDYDYKNIDDMKLYLSFAKDFYKAKNDYIAQNFLITAFGQDEINNIIDTNINTKINEFVYIDEWDSDYSHFNENLVYTNVESMVENNKVFQLSAEEYDKYFKSNNQRKTKYNLNSVENDLEVFYMSRDNYISNRGFYSETINPNIVYDAKTGIKYDDAGDVCGATSEIGYRPAIWVKIDNVNNNQHVKNNVINETVKQNVLNDNHFDENLSARILKARVITDYNKDDTISNVDTIKFGLYEQEPSRDGSNNVKETIEWIVLDKQGNQALLLSKFILDCQCYDMQNRAITWENSTLRNWLNTTFLNDAFNSNEQRYINITNVKNNSNAEYGNNTEDKLFCLSIDEVEKYFNHLSIQKINKKLSTRGTMNAKSKKGGLELLVSHSGWQSGNSPFWLRSSRGSHNWATAVSSQGMLIEGAMTGYLEYGVRPAMWVSYNPNVEWSNVNNFNETNNTTNTDNSVLGNNVHVEGADIIQNPDGSIQIGGTLQEDAKIIQKGFDDNGIQYETRDEIDKIIADSNEATLKKPIDRVYYYAKHDEANKTVTSINKKNSSNGFLGTGLFSNKTYYNIEIKFNEDTKKRLSKYAELEWNGSYKSGQDWVLLAGNTMNDLENVSWFGITPFKDSDRVANTKELSYYQKGTLHVHSLSANEQNRVYNKLKNAKVIVLATHNVIKDDRVVFSEEEKLGNVERFEYVKDDGSHINLVNAYIDCEEKVVEYTNDHNGYFLYVKDGFTGDLAYHEEIVAPKKKCNKFEILVFGNYSLSYSIYGNKVNFLAGKEVGGLKKFQVFGGKMDWIFELNTKDGFEDYEKYYLENKDKW